MLVSARQDVKNLLSYQQNVDNIGQNDLSSNEKHYHFALKPIQNRPNIFLSDDY